MTTPRPSTFRVDWQPIPAEPGAEAPDPAPAPTDAELRGAVRAALCGKGYSPLRAVGVDAAAGHVLLHGPVPSFHLKQVAQEAARAVPGVSELVNDLAVPDAS